MVAIGEAGLDYYYKHSSPEAQAEGFRQHIAAARRTGLPLVIHTRDADDDTLAILEEEHARNGAFPAILHCYTGGAEARRRAVELGLYVSFSGVVTFKKSEALRDIAARRAARSAAGRDRCAVPGAGAVSRQDATSRPTSCIRRQTLAKVKGVSPAELASATTDNFFRLFRKVKRPAQRGTAAA